MSEPAKPMRLTRLGEIANRFGVMTPPSFYQRALADIIREQDAGSDWEFMISERIEGLKELLARVNEVGSSEMSKPPPKD